MMGPDASSGLGRAAARRPAMADVAALAGVSPQTVSRVSMGASNVRPETRSRVQAAMDELGYLPNRAAQALRYGHFGTIGLVARVFTRTGVSHTIEAVVDAARAEGYGVSLFDVDEPTGEGFDATVGRLTHQAVDGLIILRAETSAPESLSLPSRLPVVVADSRFVGVHAAVGCDDVGGTRAAVQHLLDLGHRTVSHIRGPADSVQAGQRELAWADTLRAAGRTVPDVMPGDWTPASGYEQGRRLAADPAVTAVFCANDEMAAGCYRALWEAGRRVPHDVSVVGFDDVLGDFLLPPLTTVTQDFVTIGHELVRLLLRQIRQGKPDTVSRILVPTELVVRGSTAPPPAGLS